MAALTEPAFWVLTALSEQARHGYAILRRVDELTEGGSTLRVTTLYATLERLDRAGHVRVVSEEVVDGRARRTYDLTDAGRQVLVAETERLLVRARVASASLGLPRPAWPRTAARPAV